ncbi:hypothetical protein QBC40DRAFT_263847 [Triangularia verruculosa]|uniref:PNPLA domain-containing protein n=1 Tax=Triangularia verruculosa TaxID=2587418 RepID=A0AAN6XJH5_9PEZI|nr:hypothetical protein QBC40DRAFT_263847 [Triangularia verruculosa]
MSAENEPINLVSFDGGGVRGVTSLLILHKLMITIKEQHGLAEVPKPCEFFHMMAGTSTGGLIAIMLGRLRMSTEEALVEYDRCAGKIFSSKKWSNMSEKFPSTPLRETIQDLVKRRNLGELMKDPTNPPKGKAVICVMPANEVAAPRLVRTFHNADGWDKDIKIWEAARATTAASTFFKPQPLTSGGTTELYIDAAIGINNPSSYLLQEAVKEFGADRKFGCLVSIGTGTRQVHVGRARSGFMTVIEAPKVVIDVLKVVKNTATDGEEAHRQVAGRFKQCKGSYFRFNVDGAAAAAKLHHYGKMGILKTMTEKYLMKPSVVASLDEVANLLEHSGYEHGLSLGHIAHLDPTQIVRASPKARSRGEASPFFTGREDILDRLDKFFSKRDTGGKPRRQFLLYGIGGAGKTQIAYKFAETAEDRFNKVYYVDGTDIVTITQSYAKIASEEGWGSGGSEQLRLIALKKLAEDPEEWFLIFDNCSPSNRQENVPISNKGNILYTSRDHDLMLEFPDSCVYKVTEMNEGDASELLLTAAGSRYDPKDTHDKALALDVVNELGCLPLAVSQAAAYIRAGMCRLDEYSNLFETERTKLLSNPRFRGASKYDQAVYATFEASCRAIRAIKRREGNSKTGLAADMAMRVLNLVCFFHNEDIVIQTPERAYNRWMVRVERRSETLKLDGILEALSGKPDITPEEFFMVGSHLDKNDRPFLEGLRMLEKFSLVDLKKSPGLASMHVLVHTWARDRLEKEKWARHAHMARMIALESLVETNDIIDDFYLRLVVPHVRACLQHVAPESQPFDILYEGYLLSNLAILSRSDKRYEEAIANLKRFIFIWKTYAWDKVNSVTVVKALSYLMKIYHEKGDLAAAEATGIEAHYRLMQFYIDLLENGEILKDEEEQAKKELERERVAGGPLPGSHEADDQGNPSSETAASGPRKRDDTAFRNHYNNLSLTESIQLEVASISERMAEIYHDQGDLQQMGNHLETCLDIRKRLMAPDDIELWQSEDEFHRKTTKLRDAMYWGRRRDEIEALVKKYGLEDTYVKHTYLRRVHQNFADSIVRTQQFTNKYPIYLYETALELYVGLLKSFSTFHIYSDRRVLEARRMMIFCYVKLERGDEAEDAARKCLELARNEYGDWHQETALSLEELHRALVCSRGGCDREALHVIEQALVRGRIALGMGHRISKRMEKKVEWALNNLQPELSTWELSTDDELLRPRFRVDEVVDKDENRIQLFGPSNEIPERRMLALEEAKEFLKKPSKGKANEHTITTHQPISSAPENTPPSKSIRKTADESSAPEDMPAAKITRKPTAEPPNLPDRKEDEPEITSGQYERSSVELMDPEVEENMQLLRRYTDQMTRTPETKPGTIVEPASTHFKMKPRTRTHYRRRALRTALYSFLNKGKKQDESIELTTLKPASDPVAV